MKLFREALSANTEEIVHMDSQYITVINMGEGNAYLNWDKTATLDSLLVPAGMYRSFYFPYLVQNVHVIVDGEALIQIDNVR